MTVELLERILRLLREGEPRMTDDSPVRVDFLSRDDVVMGSIGGTPVETAYWSIDEEVVALVVRTDKRVEL